MCDAFPDNMATHKAKRRAAYAKAINDGQHPMWHHSDEEKAQIAANLFDLTALELWQKDKECSIGNRQPPLYPLSGQEDKARLHGKFVLW